jgi:4-hydroxy-3-methylbut-2-enyl diphosphate reductase
MIVHNKHVTDAFEEEGIITLDGTSRLDIIRAIEKGTVIYTAHGVSPEVRRIAHEKGLHEIDATCPDVTKTHDLIRDKEQQGYEVIYIGKKGHPEPEGAIGIAPSIVHLIEAPEDIHSLSLTSEKILITNQTTMSQWDVAEIIKQLLVKYPHAEVHKEICLATQVRQEAVAEQAKECDLVLVVGDPRSNNSNRLAQVSEEIAGTPAYRIADVSEIQLEWLQGVNKVGVTSGASTPTPITKEVIDFLQKFDHEQPESWIRERKVALEKILPKVKTKP